MPSALLIVATTTLLTADEQFISDRLTNQSWTVTTQNASDASYTTGMNLVVVAQNIVSATVGTKLDALTAPVLSLAVKPHSLYSTVANPGVTTSRFANVTGNSTVITGAYSGIQQLKPTNGTISNYGTPQLAGGVIVDASGSTATTPNLNQGVVTHMDIGGALTDASPVSSRRSMVGLATGYSTWTQASLDWFDAAVTWLTATGTNNDTASGFVALSGARSEALSHTGTLTGTVALSGALTRSESYQDASAGTIVLSGAKSEIHTHTGAGTGVVFLNGYTGSGGAGAGSSPWRPAGSRRHRHGQ